MKLKAKISRQEGYAATSQIYIWRWWWPFWIKYSTMLESNPFIEDYAYGGSIEDQEVVACTTMARIRRYHTRMKRRPTPVETKTLREEDCK